MPTLEDIANENPAVFNFMKGDAPPKPETDDYENQAVPKGLVEDSKSADVIPRSAMEMYQDTLTDYELSLQDAADIVDKLVTEQSYTETVRVTKRLKVELRTRTPAQIARMYEVLESTAPSTQGSAVAIISKYNLAFSLVSYAGKKLYPDTEDGLRSSLDLINRIPGPLYNVLLSKLTWFDDKLNTVMQEEAIVNF